MFSSTCSSLLEYVQCSRVRVHVYSSTCSSLLEYVQCSLVRVHVLEYVFMFTLVRVHVFEYVFLICYLLKAGLGIIQHNTRLLDTFRR